MDYLQIASKVIDSRLESGNDNGFYLFDVEDVKNKYRAWVNNIPRVKPFYAMKCNNHELVLKALRDEGSGFDCASKKEIQKVLDLNVAPERIIYSHTAKQISHLKFAAEKKVQKVTFDSEQELYKIKQFHPSAEVVLRIRFDSDETVVQLGLKFGCDCKLEAPKLIELCKKLDLNLIGVSFHVGSGTEHGKTHSEAIKAVRGVFDVAKKFDFSLNFVDIGGGFVGNLIEITTYSKPINEAIETYFDDPSITIISEPGRYFVESAFIRVFQIILKKITLDGRKNYYVNDGIYMSFLFNHITHGKYFKFGEIDVIRKSNKNDGSDEKFDSILWGNTCDSNDSIMKSVQLPDLEIGDWLLFKNMGAYTMATCTSFNSFTIDTKNDIIDA